MTWEKFIPWMFQPYKKRKEPCGYLDMLSSR